MPGYFQNVPRDAVLLVENSPAETRLKVRRARDRLPGVSHLNQARKVFDIELAALKAVRAQLENPSTAPWS